MAAHAVNFIVPIKINYTSPTVPEEQPTLRLIATYDNSTIHNVSASIPSECTSIVVGSALRVDNAVNELDDGKIGVYADIETCYIVSKSDICPSTCENMFSGLTQVESITFEDEIFDTSNVTSMEYMFYNCTSLLEIYVNFFSSSLGTMSNMFYRCTNLQTIRFHPDWTTKNVTDMSSMFAHCSSLETIYVSENWNLDNIVGSIYYNSKVFYGCTKLHNEYNFYDADNISYTMALTGAAGYFTAY